jgi:hypothetical protein
MTEPNYIVIRPASNLPPGLLPQREDGRWYDLTLMPSGPPIPSSGMTDVVAVPAGRFETREDGAVAEVWEVRP